MLRAMKYAPPTFAVIRPVILHAHWEGWDNLTCSMGQVHSGLLLQGSPCGGHLSGAGLPCMAPFPLFDADVDSVNIGLVASALFQSRARRGIRT